MDLGLRRKRAIVTGASKGIGRRIALGLAAEGASVAICARGERALRETERALRDHGVDAFAAPCDVRDAGALDAFLDAAKERLGGVDILVNNASALAFADDRESWTAGFEVDVMGSVGAVWRVVPWMEEAGGGAILFISSTAALEAGAPAPYAAAKAALISYSKILAVDLAGRRIRVNTIAPGAIEFPGGLWDDARKHDRASYDSMLSTIPWGRMGSDDEVADVAVFLVSERASWVTGACVSVDGGQHKGNL